MAESKFLRLGRIEVEGLFDTYNHHIELNLKDRATLLHGPNGVGKTVILQMIDALLGARLVYFRTIPFSRFLLGFHDGSTLELRVNGESKSSNEKHTLTLTRDGEVESAEVNLNAIADSTSTGEAQATWSALSSILGRLPDPGHHGEEDIGWFHTFLQYANAHLIEVQRLVRIDKKPTRPDPKNLWTYQESSTIPAVAECSKDFQKRLSDTMARYGRESQTLDQSFPRRLISATDKLTVDELQEHMTALDKKTDALKAIGILDKTSEHPFDGVPLGNIDPTQARVMTLYVRDTEKKLQALDDLASRTRLLLENVNQKYRHKQIRLDREDGFVAESDNGQPLSLESLSSGEQHELVLHYDLLFRVPSNTLVLIDEPELSLHVAWQKRFLPELLKILQLSDFDALIATHSPFIIGDREDLMVGLGDPD